MTTDDLQRLAASFPEWVKESYGILDIIKGEMRLTEFSEEGLHDDNGAAYGEGTGRAIFSALLDEIAEKEFGCYLCRDLVCTEITPVLNEEWLWLCRTIDDSRALTKRHPTKLDALLALKQ